MRTTSVRKLLPEAWGRIYMRQLTLLRDSLLNRQADSFKKSHLGTSSLRGFEGEKLFVNLETTF